MKKYWEIIADSLNASGWSWRMTTVCDAYAGKLFALDAHRGDLRARFVVRSAELLTAFLAGEQATVQPRRWPHRSRREALPTVRAHASQASPIDPTTPPCSVHGILADEPCN